VFSARKPNHISLYPSACLSLYLSVYLSTKNQRPADEAAQSFDILCQLQTFSSYPMTSINTFSKLNVNTNWNIQKCDRQKHQTPPLQTPQPTTVAMVTEDVISPSLTSPHPLYNFTASASNYGGNATP